MPTDSLPLPWMARIRQRFDTTSIADPARAVRETLETLSLARKVKPGETVGITVGSRGIQNLAALVAAQIEFFRGLGAVPVIIPAMGSHGGATAEGQEEILASYGITAASMGVEIRSSMETVVLGESSSGIPIHFAREALRVDHLVAFNRIKLHTDFAGPLESGLHKILMIGLGKQHGAATYHRAITGEHFAPVASEVVPILLERCSVLCGVAVVENALEETALVEAIPPETLATREPELLELSRSWMPRLPLDRLDLLIIDRIGKNISGTGMDLNIVGRKFHRHFSSDRDSVDCRRIFIRGLAEQSHGNASGVGYADFISERMEAAIDRQKTSINCITSSCVSGAAIPVSLPNDHACIIAALGTIGLTTPTEARVVQIADTLHLDELLVSKACLQALEGRDDIDILSDPAPMSFDADNNLPDVG